MNKSTKKRIGAVGIACALCLSMVASFAYFTDRVELQATGTSGNVQIESTAFAGANKQNVLVDRDGLDNLNPGDARDLTFTVSNEGNKAVDVRHTIMLTVTDASGDALALSQEAGQAEFDIYLKDDVVYDATKGWIPVTGKTPIFSTADKYDEDTQMGYKREINEAAGTIIYTFADTTLLGKNGAANSERTATPSESTQNVLMDAENDAVTYEYVLVYRGTSLNAFMNSGIQIDMIVEAKQHYNTADTWATVAEQSYTAGNLVEDVVPEKGEEIVNDGVELDDINSYDVHGAINGNSTGNKLDPEGATA